MKFNPTKLDRTGMITDKEKNRKEMEEELKK